MKAPVLSMNVHVALILSLLSVAVHGFSPQQRHPQMNRLIQRQHVSLEFHNTLLSKSSSGGEQRATGSTALFMSEVDGRGRGLYIMGAVLLLNLWFFTIPPEFRRSKICPEEVAAAYEQCKSPKQFNQEIIDYYRNGGGIQWDFSIDPKTKEANDEFKSKVFGTSETVSSLSPTDWQD